MDAAVFQLPWANVLSGVALTMRAVGFVFVAPVVGAEGVPPQLRAALALLIVVLLAPVVPAPAVGTSVYWLCASEFFVGFAIGFVCRLAFEALLFAGSTAGYPTGLAMASMLDPYGQSQVANIGIFYQVFGSLIFLAMGGHRQALYALARSYEIVPAGAAKFSGPWLPSLVTMTGQVFSIGLRLAAPIIVAGILVDVCLMLIARAVPQMNILVVGAPVRLGVGLIALAFSLHVFAPLVAESIDAASRDAGQFLKALAARG